MSNSCVSTRSVIGMSVKAARPKGGGKTHQIRSCEPSADLAATSMSVVADTVPVMTSSQHDFDFIFGHWCVRNRKLVDVTDPACDQWVEFDAVSDVSPILFGMGHIDQMTVAAPADGGAPFEGFTLRLFDPSDQTWRIWWSSDASAGHSGYASGGPLRRHSWRLRRVGHDRWSAGVGPLPMAGRSTRRTSVATVVLVRRRPDVGLELADAVHQGLIRAADGDRRRLRGGMTLPPIGSRLDEARSPNTASNSAMAFSEWLINRSMSGRKATASSTSSGHPPTA